MNNQYNSPKSNISKNEVGQPVMPSTLILSIGLTIISAAIYASISLIVPQFNDLFISFGAELPGVTIFILENYKFSSFLSLISLLPCIFLFINRETFTGQEHKLFLVIVINFVLVFFVLGFVVFAMYLPLFKMGDVI